MQRFGLLIAAIATGCSDPIELDRIAPGDPEALVMADTACLSAYYPLGGSDRAMAERARQLGFIEELGVRTVRHDLRWPWIQPSRDEWRFERTDPGIAETADRGIKLILMLAYGVPWASSQTDSDDKYPPDDPEDFARFAARTVQEYGDRVRLWEIWNEQNAGYRFWKPNLVGDPEAYGLLLKATARRIRQTRDDAVVLYGGLFYHPQLIPGATSFMRSHFDAVPGGVRDFDAVAFHPYPLYPPSIAPESSEGAESSFAEMIDSLQAVLTDAGRDDVSLHATELGWPVYEDVTRERQAVYLIRGLLALAAGRVQSACWFTLDDGPNSGEFPPEDDFGLLAYDPDHFDEVEPERKPAFIALRTFLAEVGDMVVVGDVAASLSLGEDHRALMLARKDGNARAHVLWTPFERGSRFADVPRAANADVRVVDVFGRTQTVDPGSASVSVEYGPIPTLVVETRR